MTDLESSIARCATIANIKFEDAKHELKMAGTEDRNVLSQIALRQTMTQIAEGIYQVKSAFIDMFAAASRVTASVNATVSVAATAVADERFVTKD